MQAVSGDISRPGFGLSEQDERWLLPPHPPTFLLRILTEEVSIIFHSAATVKFNEELTKVPG